MDVRALVVASGASNESERVAGLPVATLDVLGKSIIQRVIDRFREFGIEKIAVVSEYDLSGRGVFSGHYAPAQGDLWASAEKAFGELAQADPDVIVIQRVGPYAEFDYEDMVRFHLDQANHVTTVVGPDASLTGAFLLSASRQNEGTYLLRHRLQTPRSPHAFYEFDGYINSLTNAADMRRLAIDAFCGNAQLRPYGEEIKPGVWADPTAMVDKRARVLAPSFIGAHAKVRATSVITRCSVIEHHCLVDQGTVVENATLLPYTSVGAGLDVAHCVVGQKRLTHLGRQTEVEIEDPRLIGLVSTSPVRMLQHLASLASFLPSQVVRGFLRRGASAERPTLADAVQTPSPALKTPEEVSFSGNLAVARRYEDE